MRRASSSRGATRSSASRSSPARAFEPMMVKDGIDATSVEGAANLPYAIPNLLVELHSPKVGVPVQWWRSVGSTHTAFSTECFLDEHRAPPPARIRSRSAARCSRSIRAACGVLELAAKQAGWGKPLREGQARAASRCMSRSIRWSRRSSRFRGARTQCTSTAWCARSTAAWRSIPTSSRMQMESGIGFGLSAALYGRHHAEGRAWSSSPTSTITRCCACRRCRGSRSTSCPRARQAHRRRRAGHAGHRPGAGQCARRARGQTPTNFAPFRCRNHLRVRVK